MSRTYILVILTKKSCDESTTESVVTGQLLGFAVVLKRLQLMLYPLHTGAPDTAVHPAVSPHCGRTTCISSLGIIQVCQSCSLVATAIFLFQE
jgi:hypothetical protein